MPEAEQPNLALLKLADLRLFKRLWWQFLIVKICVHNLLKINKKRCFVRFTLGTI